MKSGKKNNPDESATRNIFFRRVINRLEDAPSCKYSTATKNNIKKMNSLIDDTSLLLLVGGGVGSHGNHINLLRQHVLQNAVNIEIVLGPNVDIVADGHQLPFGDYSFDCIICQAVLEHTRDSQKVVKEIYRVLKRDGIVYAEIPFLQPVHMSSDYRRYSLMGIDELFASFTKLQSGVNGAVASSFALIAVEFFATLFSFKIRKLYCIFLLLLPWLFFPVKYLDVLFCNYESNNIAAAGCYFLGKK